MKRSRVLVNLLVSQLIPHPDNPRKDLGDITELTESVKKNGVLQNLTVTPIDKDGNPAGKNNADRYMVIIGHRRLAAAKAAGLWDVPCTIVEEITHDEQLLMMLEENIQREDLTIYDQAQGFQMMLDLGQTVEDIEEKSGFSKTTIYHRLNIAKLDKETLKEKQEDDSFQLNMSDLYELEKVKDAEKRNDILKRSRNSNEIKYLAQATAKEEKKQKNIEKISKILEDNGVEPLPEHLKTWNCEHVADIPYDSEEIHIDNIEGAYYYKGYTGFTLYREKEEVEVDTTLYDRKKEKESELKKRIDAVGDSLVQTFIDIAAGRLKVDDPLKGAEYMLNIFSVTEPKLDWQELCTAWAEIKNIGEPDEGEEDQFYADTRRDIEGLPLYQRMALALTDIDLYGFYNIWQAEFNKIELDSYYEIIKNLKPFGYVLDEEHKKMLEGTHPIFKEYEKAKDEYENT